ncbi:MAG TPA: ABC transporter ATP-binding protein [Castellaniella sp.]|uniref:ABC transporter ATP-binding protein n=1 Tax=Castellaniella sp. TaxID=1955812 RepID=UPI002F0E569F
MSTTVTIKDVSKKFSSEVVALNCVSAEIKANSFVSIVGPSGCGKSTLLRIIAGLVPATSGQITVGGKQVDGPISDSGMVFQGPVLLQWRTVLENILFVAEIGGKNARDYKARALELIELAGLKGFENSYPHQLSGGMQQRASICRALLLNPSLILMDEPFGALDVMTRERLGFELQDIWSASKNTVIFVTHSITEAVLLSDTIIVMTARPGRIQNVIEVDLPRARTLETLRTPRFLELSAQVREGIGTQWEG